MPHQIFNSRISSNSVIKCFDLAKGGSIANDCNCLINYLFTMLSGDTLQNCTLELATLGDLKLVERPHSVVLAPHDFCNIKANVKVSSTENGIIFGNIGKQNVTSA